MRRRRRLAGRDAPRCAPGSPPGARARSAWRRSRAPATSCAGRSTAARLGLELGVRVGELSPAQLRALDLELGRASLALDDLAAAGLRAARRGARATRSMSRSCSATRSRRGAHRPPPRGAALAFEWTGAPGARVGRAAAARPGHREPDRQRDRARGRGDQRSWFARARASPVRIEVVDAGPGLPAPVADLARRPRGGRGLAVAGWRSPRRSRVTTVADSPRRLADAAPGSCSSCPGRRLTSSIDVPAICGTRSRGRSSAARPVLPRART